MDKNISSKKTYNPDKRSHERPVLEGHPIAVKRTDGEKISAFVHNISIGGLQIRCSRLSAHILWPKMGLLNKKDAPQVEISLVIPLKGGGLLKIEAIYILKYIGAIKGMGMSPEKNFAVGLQIISYKGKSMQALKKLLAELVSPIIQ